MPQALKSFQMAACLLTALLLLLPHSFLAADPAQLVSQLPGQPHVQFKQYAGHITVNAAKGRALFYWFYQANRKNHASLPLLLWLNGGPGCSSIGLGALSELGPFRSDGSDGLTLNEFAWTEASNLLFLESPRGVGFSYSNTTETFDDDLAAEDALIFLLEWFKKFPEYARNEFFLAGESYAGRYIPTTMARILKHNSETLCSNAINIQGFLLGNGWTDDYLDAIGRNSFLYSHSLISRSTYRSLKYKCDFKNNKTTSPECNGALWTAAAELDKLDPFNIYGPNCNKPLLGNTQKTAKLLDAGVWSRYLAAINLPSPKDPCMDTITPYLNREDVKKALHVDEQMHLVWEVCREINYNPNYATMLPIYRDLVKAGLRIWIYSGDMDSVVPTTGTRKWLEHLNLTVKIPWYPWRHEDQVGGWAEVYEGLTFTTIRGSGHLVPADKAKVALDMFRRFLAGDELPSFAPALTMKNSRTMNGTGWNS